jgi:putative SOS response-associated peptidase YedK
MKLGEPFAIAGLWEEFSDTTAGELVRTFAIATCEPNDLMATVHDRMPVLLALPTIYAGWNWSQTRATCCGHIRQNS